MALSADSLKVVCLHVGSDNVMERILEQDLFYDSKS